jgi:hypothetical protein
MSTIPTQEMYKRQYREKSFFHDSHVASELVFSTWELVCNTFWNKNFGMQKVTPPAPSYDAASDSDTKLIFNLGIQYVILFRSTNCIKKVSPLAYPELPATVSAPRLNDVGIVQTLSIQISRVTIGIKL